MILKLCAVAAGREAGSDATEREALDPSAMPRKKHVHGTRDVQRSTSIHPMMIESAMMSTDIALVQKRAPTLKSMAQNPSRKPWA